MKVNNNTQRVYTKELKRGRPIGSLQVNETKLITITNNYTYLFNINTMTGLDLVSFMKTFVTQ